VTITGSARSASPARWPDGREYDGYSAVPTAATRLAATKADMASTAPLAWTGAPVAALTAGRDTQSAGIPGDPFHFGRTSTRLPLRLAQARLIQIRFPLTMREPSVRAPMQQ
jgi:hypothetical protein